jgi:hypothetical protein
MNYDDKCFTTCAHLSKALAVCDCSTIRDHFLFNIHSHLFLLYAVWSPVLPFEEIIFNIVLCMVLKEASPEKI